MKPVTTFIFFVLVVLCAFTPATGQAPGGVSTNLQLWLRADKETYTDRNGALKGSTSAQSGDAVHSWADQAGARTNAATTINGLGAPIFYNHPDFNINFNPVLRFDGSDDGLDFYDDYVFSAGTGLEIFAVVKPNGGSTAYTDRNFIVDIGNYSNSGYGLAYSNGFAWFYSAIGSGGNNSYSSHFNGQNPVALRGEYRFGLNKQKYLFINGGNYVAQSTGSIYNLTSNEINESPTHELIAGPLTIGRQSKDENLLVGKKLFDGNIAEVLIYDNDLNDIDANKIQTYLAIKYGLTLASGGGALPRYTDNYVSSSGTIIWDKTALANFHFSIGAIGRDDVSGLDQRQSQSSNPFSVLSIGHGDIESTNNTNGTAFEQDNSFMLWGNYRDYETTFNQSFEEVSNSRMKRYWIIKEIGLVGTVKIRIPNTVTTVLSDEDMHLVVSSNNTFDLSDELIVMTNDGEYFTCTYDFSDGQYFTFMKGAYTQYCNTGNVLTASNGTISDGSGDSNYSNDADCNWRISVPGASKITLDFSSFVTYDANDYVKVFNGSNNGAPLLGTFSGDRSASLPVVSSTGPDMYVEFKTNSSNRAAGWGADYYATFVSGATSLSDLTGTLTDGSGAGDYGNRTNASWTINPGCSGPVTLTFTEFITADENDAVSIYDGLSSSARLIGSYYGDLSASLPEVIAPSGKMHIVFTTDASGSAAGWNAEFSSNVLNEGTGLATAGPGGLTTDLAIWLRADREVYADRLGPNRGSIAASSGDSVQSWGDVSGARSNDATTINGLGTPVWHDDPTRNINFNPVLRFNGTSDGLDLFDDYLFLNKSGAEMIAVVLPDDESSGPDKFIIDNGSYSGNGFGLAYSGDRIQTYGDDGANGGEISLGHTLGSLPTLIRGELRFSATSKLFLNEQEVGSLSNSSLARLACSELQLSEEHSFSAGPLTIGRQSQIDGLVENTRFFKGSIAELIVFNKAFPTGSTTEQQKVRTYLALKYGITPWSAISNQHDLLSSAGNVIFNRSQEALYFFDLAGIGRDDASGLDQRQTKSVNPGAVLTIGLGDIAATNNTNPSSFPADQSFLIWGRLQATSTSFDTEFEGHVNARMNRSWRIEETGAVGSIKLSIPDTITTLQSDEHLYLVVSSDKTFTLADDTVRMTRDGGFFTCSYDFGAGRSFFTFFKASYALHCSSSIVTSSNGSIEDGSGLGTDYGHNSDCNWLISVPGAQRINLVFSRFVTYDAHDVVTIYDGGDATAPVLGMFSGDLSAGLPVLSSTGGSIYIRFVTNSANRAEGWQASYHATFATGNTAVSAQSGTIHDGSPAEAHYGNNTIASWTVQVPCAWNISLDFTRFITDGPGDVVTLYDGPDDSFPVLGSFSGNLDATLPSVLTSGEFLFITFITDGNGSASGWSAEYASDVPANGTGAAATGPVGITNGLALWLKADAEVYSDRSGYLRGATQAINGGPVNSWGDYSGSRTKDATTANGLGAPIWQDNPERHINFNPVLLFDGVDDGFDFHDDWLFGEKDGLEIIAVVHPDADSRDSTNFLLDFGSYPLEGYGLAYSSEYTRLYGNVHSGGLNLKVHHAYNSVNPHEMSGYHPAMIRSEFIYDVNSRIYRNGSPFLLGKISNLSCLENNMFPVHEAGRGPLTIGRQAKNDELNGRLFKGTIAELMVFDRNLTQVEEQKIQTYLALKYGIPLHNVAGDLLNSDGEIIWDAGINQGYHQGLMGIGRDDASGLYQKQSKSNSDESVLAIGLGGIEATNSANPGLFPDDKSFMICGHPVQSPNWSSDFEGSVNARMTRVWLVKEIGTVGIVEVGLSISALPTLYGCEQVYLIVDRDKNGVWDLNDTLVVMSRDGDYYRCKYDFMNDDKFAFVKYEDRVYIELPGANTVIRAEEYCNLGASGYTYFYDVNDPEKLRFAVEKFPVGDGANASEFDVAVTITTKNNPAAPSGIIGRTDELNTQGTFMMGRYWNASVVSGAMSGWVNVRYYFDKADTLAALNAATAFNDLHGGLLPQSSMFWFKSHNEELDTAKVLASGYDGNRLMLADYEYGIEGGISYVEFKKIRSFSGGTGFYEVNGNTTLPIRLLSFEVDQVDAGVQILWSTAEEKNTETFQIERSEDGARWAVIGEQAAAGNSTVRRNYSMMDNSPAYGPNYYRLKSVDFDGTFDYSPSRRVLYSPAGFELRAYPNPARDKFQVSLPYAAERFDLYNAMGKPMQLKSMQDGNTYTLEVPHLPRGMYFLKVQCLGQEHSLKLILE